MGHKERREADASRTQLLKAARKRAIRAEVEVAVRAGLDVQTLERLETLLSLEVVAAASGATEDASHRARVLHRWLRRLISQGSGSKWEALATLAAMDPVWRNSLFSVRAEEASRKLRKRRPAKPDLPFDEALGDRQRRRRIRELFDLLADEVTLLEEQALAVAQRPIALRTDAPETRRAVSLPSVQSMVSESASITVDEMQYELLLRRRSWAEKSETWKVRAVDDHAGMWVKTSELSEEERLDDLVLHVRGDAALDSVLDTQAGIYVVSIRLAPPLMTGETATFKLTTEWPRGGVYLNRMGAGTAGRTSSTPFVLHVYFDERDPPRKVWYYRDIVPGEAPGYPTDENVLEPIQKLHYTVSHSEMLPNLLYGIAWHW